MTSDGKLLKISCLAGLFLGLASLGLGLFLEVAASFADMDAWVTAFEGLLSTVFGVRCAILANVPSNTAKIRSKALILLAVSVCAIACLVYVGKAAILIQLSAAAAILAVAFIAVVLAHRIVRAQLRK